MKKVVTFILALAIVFCGVAAINVSVSAKTSPTAPTITRPTGGSDPATIPSSPHVTTQTKPTGTSPDGSTKPGDPTGPDASKPTTPSQTAGTTKPGPSTTPDGSTITGTVKPDDHPTAPETGSTSTEVFVFAGAAVACTAAAILLRKNKDDEQ